jgi:hypothetical protein
MNDTENTGMGVLIKMLGGNADAVAAVKAAIGETITSVSLDDNRLVFDLTNGTKLVVWDGGQSCCESRYMTTADKLGDYAGSVLLGFELKDAPPIPDEYGGSHEVQFLDVRTSKGVFQMANHNEHNGYYGGFWVEAKLEAKP